MESVLNYGSRSLRVTIKHLWSETSSMYSGFMMTAPNFMFLANTWSRWTTNVSLSPTRNRRFEVVECQSFTHRYDVVVEVSTDYDRSVWVLSDDIFDDVQDSFGSVL